MRQPKGWFDSRRNKWLARLGPPSKRNGKPTTLVLTHKNGKPLAESDVEEVARAVARVLAQREATRDAVAPLPDFTVAEVVHAFLEDREAAGAKPSTIAGHHHYLRQFGATVIEGVPILERRATDITLAHLTEARRAMEGRGCQTGTIRLLYASVLACWRWASRPITDRDPVLILPSNALAGTPRPPKGRGRRIALPWETVRALLDHCDLFARQDHPNGRRKSAVRAVAARLVGESGARPGEVMALHWAWWKPIERCFVMPATEQKTGWRTGKERTFAVPTELARRIEELRADSHPTYVFEVAGAKRGGTGSSPAKHFSKWFTKVIQSAREHGMEIPEGVSLYTLRHSFITFGRKIQVNPYHLADAAGHDIAVANATYNHPDFETFRSVVDRIAKGA